MGTSKATLILVSFAGVAFLFQIIGYASPAWLIYGLDMGGGDDAQPGTGSSSSSDNNFDFSKDIQGMENDGDSMPSDLDSDFSNLGNTVKSETHGMSDMGSGMGGMGMSAMTKTSVDIQLGLWMARACVDLAGMHTCQSVSMSQIQDTISGGQSDSLGKGAAAAMIGNFSTIQGLTTCALICCIIGGIVLFIFLRTEMANGFVWKGVLCASLWGLSVLFLIPAIVLAVQKSSDLHNASNLLKNMPYIKGVSIDVHTPWAAIMTGIGAFMSAVVGFLTALHVCTNKDREVMPGTWFKFTNKA